MGAHMGRISLAGVTPHSLDRSYPMRHARIDLPGRKKSEMPLTNEEIFIGAVAYFSVDAIKGDQFERTGAIDMIDPGAVRPFVCYIASETSSCWSPITSTHRDERLMIAPTDRELMPGPMMYLADGRNSVRGPNNAFIEAANGCDTKNASTRPRVRYPKIFAVRDEIDLRGGLHLHH